MSELPSGWTVSPLRDLGKWVGGGTPSKRNPSYWEGDIPWVSPKDMKVQQLRTAADGITPEAIEQSSTCLVPGGSVLVVTRSGILRHTLPVAVTQREVAINQDLKALVPAGGISPDYVAWGLRAAAFRILASCTKAGTTVSNIATSRLLDWILAVPPTAEQRRIVAAIEEQFSRLDAAYASLEAGSRRLDALRTRVVDETLKGDWPWTTLGEAAEVVGGVTKDAKRQNDPTFVEVPYLRVANVQRGYLDLTEVARIRVAPEKAAMLALRPGDVLFNEGGDRDKLGRGWVWSGEIDGCIHQNHVFRARLDGAFEPKFVSWHGNTFGRKWFEEHGRQTTNLASLNLTTLKRFPVPAPPLNQQRRVVAEIEQRLSVIDAMATTIVAVQKRSIALRRAVLDRAFRGELVPQDPSDEPAAVLMERIRAERAAAGPADRAP